MCVDSPTLPGLERVCPSTCNACHRLSTPDKMSSRRRFVFLSGTCVRLREVVAAIVAEIGVHQVVAISLDVLEQGSILAQKCRSLVSNMSGLNASTPSKSCASMSNAFYLDVDEMPPPDTGTMPAVVEIAAMMATDGGQGYCVVHHEQGTC